MKKGILIGLIIALSLPVLAWKTSDRFIKIGKNGDITIFMGSIGQIRFNSSISAIEFTNDGTNFKKLGTGAGGAGGQNFFDINPDADSGTTGWTNIGGGSFSINQTNPINGDNDFSWDASAQNDILRSDVTVIPEFFKGKACQIQFRFTGSTDDLVEPQVVDTSFVVIPTALYRNQIDQGPFLKAQSGIVQRSIFFICPTSGDIHFQFNQTQAGNPALMRFDDFHNGENLGLVQTVLPDHFSAVVTDGSPALVTSENVDWINGDCVRNGTGDYTCTFISGIFTVIPSCHATAKTAARLRAAQIKATTTGSINILVSDDAATAGNISFDLSCDKQGVDAQQSVQVFTSIPKVSEFINNFSAQVSAGSAVTNENVEWITGTCPRSGTGSQTITCAVTGFTVIPNCACLVTTGGQVSSDRVCQLDRDNSTASSLVFFQTNNGAAANQAVSILCQKQGVDFKQPTAQLILVNQVQTNFQLGVTTESCSITNTGTPAIIINTGCGTWIDSITDVAVGRMIFNLTLGVFSSMHHCSITGSRAAAGGIVNGQYDDTDVTTALTTSAVAITTIQHDASPVDHDLTIKCTGAR